MQCWAKLKKKSERMSELSNKPVVTCDMPNKSTSKTKNSNEIRTKNPFPATKLNESGIVHVCWQRCENL